MSGYSIATLKCDGCGKIWHDGHASTVTAARRGAAGSGWSRPKRRIDLCGACTNVGHRAVEAITSRVVSGEVDDVIEETA